MDRSLCKAVKEGNCEKVRELSHNNPQILQTITPLGNTALHVAASRKDHKLAELLLSLKPCIILMSNVNQETALHKAAAAGCLEVVELLLNFKSNGIRCNSSYCTHPKGYDLEEGRLDLDDLWKAPNVENETALHYAARGDYVEIVSLLLKKVKDIEIIVNRDGESALYTACEHGSERTVLKLGEMDCIPDMRKDKRTCLHLLLDIEGPFADMALYLLQKRPALAEKADAADNVPLHFASIRGSLKIVEELLRISPDMALRKNKDEMAAIHYAARLGYEDIVSCLIDCVPDCTEVLGKDNKNALHFALEYGHIGVAKTLLLESIDPSFLINHADKDGQTAFHKAAANSELASEMLSPMLEISRWNINAPNNNGLAMLNVVQAKIMKANITVIKKRICWTQLRKCGARRKARVNLFLERSTHLLEGPPKMDSEDEVEDRQNMSLIATLVFTVSFAAALTVPGGIRSDNGVPVRMHATAFQCFTVSNSVAFCSSILAMFIFTIKSREKQEVCLRINGFILFRASYYRGVLSFGVGNKMFPYSGPSMVYNAINATVVAFITGVYVTVAPKCLWLALTVCTMGVLTVFTYFFMVTATKKDYHLFGLRFGCCYPRYR